MLIEELKTIFFDTSISIMEHSSVSLTFGSEISISSTNTRVFAESFTLVNPLHDPPPYYLRSCNFQSFIISDLARSLRLRRVHSGGSITGAFSRAVNDELHVVRKVMTRSRGTRVIRRIFNIDTESDFKNALTSLKNEGKKWSGASIKGHGNKRGFWITPKGFMTKFGAIRNSSLLKSVFKDNATINLDYCWSACQNPSSFGVGVKQSLPNATVNGYTGPMQDWGGSMQFPYPLLDLDGNKIPEYYPTGTAEIE